MFRSAAHITLEWMTKLEQLGLGNNLREDDGTPRRMVISMIVVACNRLQKVTGAGERQLENG